MKDATNNKYNIRPLRLSIIAGEQSNRKVPSAVIVLSLNHRSIVSPVHKLKMWVFKIKKKITTRIR
ncbi:hypothetical protein COS74_02080 [bacterium CG06_land_8_20_14_3_00_33_50]|nr:MAG: hypothetical protein COS74_02080 [bacterium CG06_land_8_20_14_3_00_33_50]